MFGFLSFKKFLPATLPLPPTLPPSSLPPSLPPSLLIVCTCDTVDGWKSRDTVTAWKTIKNGGLLKPLIERSASCGRQTVAGYVDFNLSILCYAAVLKTFPYYVQYYAHVKD